LRHALISKKQSDTVVPHLQLFQSVSARSGESLPITRIRTVLGPQVTLDRPQDVGVVIHTQQNWLGHGWFSFYVQKLILNFLWSSAGKILIEAL